ncbi:MAG: MaoC family dehydratase N-terminal domain-containing protein [Dehalococcoidia bacterium]|nr:MaoC family dehydratase N-terminal domain-containing protein [Dehalococcoidia bacterium]HRC62154.1 MaoC family dehydratase N-terminal domain-containing protein [Dehalococcoidia bacterium]
MPDTSYAWQEGWESAWQPLMDLVGEDFSEGETQPAIDVVEKTSIRRYLEPLEFGCPLHFDEAAAKASGYKGILAPYSGISQTWTDQGQWNPGDPTNYPNADPNFNSVRRQAAAAGRPVPQPDTTAGFATDIEIEYFEPVCVGDHLTYSGRKLISVVPRETSVGRGAFTVWQREVHNQRGELVAQLRNGGYGYVPKPRDPGAAASTSAPAAAGPSGPIMDPAPAPHAAGITNREVDWGQQRYWEDVNEGDEVPPVIFTMTVFRLVVEAGANRDFNQIHHNTPVTQAQGAPDMYANNVFIQGMWERCVREYIGLQGRFKKTGPFRMRIFNNVGETVVTKGTVKRKWVEGGEHLVELEIVSEHSRGISVGPGPVVVTLPSRG